MMGTGSEYFRQAQSLLSVHGLNEEAPELIRPVICRDRSIKIQQIWGRQIWGDRSIDKRTLDHILSMNTLTGFLEAPAIQH